MMGVEDPSSTTADPIGAGHRCGEPARVPRHAPGPGLPLAAKGRRLFVGRWNGPQPSALATTLDISAGEGDGDECGGATP